MMGQMMGLLNSVQGFMGGCHHRSYAAQFPDNTCVPHAILAPNAQLSSLPTALSLPHRCA